MDATRLLAALAGITIFLAQSALGQSDFRTNRQQAAQPAVPTRMTRQPDFRIPFQLADNAMGTKAILLYVSSDQGRDWNLYQRQPPNATGFQFGAPEDGEFWFAVRTVDNRERLGANRNLENNLQPELKVIVDTRLPRLDLRVNSDATGQAVAEWLIHDPNLASHTFRLQYQDQTGNWQDVEIRTPNERDVRQQWDGRAQWWLPANATEGIVRAEILDRAGNATQVHKRFALANTAERATEQNSFDRTAVSGSSRRDSDTPVGDNWNEFKNGIKQQLPSWLTGAQQSGDRRQPPRQNETSALPADGPLQSVVRGPVANRSRQGFGDNQPRPRITSSPNFELDYELFDISPQGPRLVELWFTRDRGSTWELYGSDADKESPMEVQLKQEGLFGFQLVVHGFDVPPPRPPQDGAPPDMLVRVDWTKPTGRITRAALDRDDQLVVEWIAEDTMLAEEPISLSFAASPDGPWTEIANNLRNSGAYRWTVDRRLPSRTYVRLDIRDLSGNTTMAVYDVPLGSGGQNPSARIRDVRPLRRTSLRPVSMR